LARDRHPASEASPPDFGQFETSFGVGQANDRYLHHRKPGMTVDYCRALEDKTRAIERVIQQDRNRFEGLKDRNVVIASTECTTIEPFLDELTRRFP
jgi:hypothetical protein